MKKLGCRVARLKKYGNETCLSIVDTVVIAFSNIVAETMDINFI